MSSHSFQFIRFNSFIFLSIHSSQLLNDNSFFSIHAFQFLHFKSFRNLCQMIHVNSRISCISFHLIHIFPTPPWIPISHVPFSSAGHYLVPCGQALLIEDTYTSKYITDQHSANRSITHFCIASPNDRLIDGTLKQKNLTRGWFFNDLGVPHLTSRSVHPFLAMQPS